MRYRLHREAKVVSAIQVNDNDCICIFHVDSSMNTSFKLPKFGTDYTERVSARCEGLIQYRIWEGFDLTRLRQWRRNFTTDEAQYFSACLLDSLIYRSEPQTCALSRQLFQRSLPDVIRSDPPPISSVSDWLNLLGGNTDPKIRVVPVIKEGDPPTKSGFLIARLLKRALRVNEAWIIKPEDIPTHANSTMVLLFVDDFLGTGNQFTQFLSGFTDYFATHYVIYAPLTAIDDGISAVRSSFPYLRVACAEQLRGSHNVFHPDSSCFDDGINTPAVAKEFQANLYEQFGIPLGREHQLGYGSAGLAYSFQHACPDNCLPLFWWSKTSSFTPLFDR